MRTRSAVAGVLTAALAVPIAAAALATAGTGSGTGAESRADLAVEVRDGAGEVLVRVPLTGEEFAVSYRNSIYGTVAEARYTVSADGRFRISGLAADQVAVLEEYYALPGPPRPAPESDRRAWLADPDPEQPAVFEQLSIAATDLGERTLHVPGHPPVALWQLVAEDPIVVLDIEET